jgi:hypothetical protein
VLTALFTATILSAPPPPAAVTEGRITFWAGDSFVHMTPTGTEVTAINISKTSQVPFGDLIQITSDRETVVYRREINSGPGWHRSKLIVSQLSGDDKSFELEGYVPAGLVLSADGKTVYFCGIQGEEWNKETWKSSSNWAFDIVSKKVARLPMPDGTGISAVSDDEKWALVVGRKTEKGVETLRTHLVSMDGKVQSEPFRQNTLVANISFSPMGDKYTTYAMAFDELAIDSVRGDKPPEYVLVDRISNVRKHIENIPNPNEVRIIKWNPAGTRIAYVWQKQVVTGHNARKLPGAETQFEYKVFVANPDGSNVKKVYETTTGEFRAFMWR